MKLLIAFAILCYVGASQAAPRIVGGKDAPDGKYPYMVALIPSKRSQTCGGSILNKRWILTAAHCLENYRNASIYVLAGTNLLKGGNGQVYQSEYHVEHQDYDWDSSINDIALIRVNKDIEFNDKVKPVELAKEEFYEANQTVTLTGWGATQYNNGNSPNELQEIALKILDQEKCKRIYKYIGNVTDGHLCTLTKVNEGACSRDSGSPLAIEGVQIGIVSWGQLCGWGKPDVYTRVHYYLDWIAAEQAKFN